MKSRLESVLSVVVTCCALVVTWIVVNQHLAGRSSDVFSQPDSVESWNLLQDGGRRIGSASAPVQIVEFVDFQCPFCSLFHQAAQDLRAELKNQVSLVLFHFPLSSHEFSHAAAMASECASEEGLFEEMVRELMASQKDFGTRTWASLASLAGVTDTVRFVGCMEEEWPRERIQKDRSIGEGLSIRGTPTIVINGWRYPQPPTDSLKRIAREILAGRSPAH